MKVVRQHDALEVRILGLVILDLGPNEAVEIGHLLRWLTDFLLLRCRDVITARAEDLRDFCALRSTTRSAKSMARLIFSIRSLFGILLGVGLRHDDPSIDLRGPTAIPSAKVPKIIDHYAVDSFLRTEAERSNSPFPYFAFLDLRRAAALRLAGEAGALFAEIAALDFDEISGDLILAAGGPRERQARLTEEGLQVVKSFVEIRSRLPSSEPLALFVSPRFPHRRLDRKGVASLIDRSIRKSGCAGKMTASAVYRSIPEKLASEGHGWSTVLQAMRIKRAHPTNRTEQDAAALRIALDKFDRFLRS